MSTELERYTKLIAKVGTEALCGGLWDLFQALSEERARRFVTWLTSKSENEQASAEEALCALLQSTDGQRLLRQVCHEVLFGTESISLAALALVASKASRLGSEPFWSRAGNAIHGLQNEDAIVIFSLLHHAADFHIEREAWMVTLHFDIPQLRKPHWADLKRVWGIGEVEVYCGVQEATRRRILLPDASRGRMGYEGEVAPLAALLSNDTARYYALLGHALEIAEPTLYAELAPLKIGMVNNICGLPRDGEQA